MSQIRYSGLASQRHAPVDSFPKIRGAGCGVREGGGLMAAEYLWGFCTGGFEKIFKSKRHRPPEPGGSERSEQGVVLPLHVGMVEPPPVQNPCQLNCGPTARVRSALYKLVPAGNHILPDGPDRPDSKVIKEYSPPYSNTSFIL